MKLRVSARLDFEARSAGTVIVSILALHTAHQKMSREVLSIPPPVPFDELLLDTAQNRVSRFEVAEPGSFSVSYEATGDNYFDKKAFGNAIEPPIAHLA